ncbi:LysR family transcriptional regulator [Enterobacter sp. RHBSTW-00994]|uniref:LysR substrate-binding domain-containing protein n=1 Tax=Enterobacteriaceae TaxID=543 RepID=UPI0015E971D6|nr:MULTISPECIES: LysR family transcriptional regulator [Enterobacteriaceae]QLR41988.1 LysR family transcriptional regulator [Enterobacter sp. RHBSTW-00994]
MNQLLAMRAFVKVIDTDSFSRAAGQLGMPRSTVSKLVTDLERHLGTTLLHRTTRSLAVTPEGKEYYQDAVRLVADLDRADNAVRRNKDSPGGMLRIDVPAVFAESLLIPALADFHREFPDIAISLGVNDRTISLVGESVDCVIRIGELLDMSMVGRKLFDMAFVTCATPGYLADKGMPGTPPDLRVGHELVGYFSAGSGRPEGLTFIKDEQRYFYERCAFSANGGSGFIAMIRAGLGVGQPLQCYVEDDLKNGRLVAVLEEWQRPSVPVHVLYPPNRHQNARLQVFIDWLIARFRKQA